MTHARRHPLTYLFRAGLLLGALGVHAAFGLAMLDRPGVARPAQLVAGFEPPARVAATELPVITVRACRAG